MSSTSKRNDEPLSPSQMKALEKCAAFIRRALHVTQSDHLVIDEMHVTPKTVHGRVQVSIRIDESEDSA